MEVVGSFMVAGTTAGRLDPARVSLNTQTTHHDGVHRVSPMASITETISSLTRLTPRLPTPSPDAAAARRIAASTANVDSVRVPPRTDHQAIVLEMQTADGTAKKLELRAGEPPIIGGGRARPKRPDVWKRLDAATFGEANRSEAVWLHQPWPPGCRELPSLMLEALGRAAGLAAGVDGVLDSPLRLNHGQASRGALVAAIAQPCVCSRVPGERHGGAAHGAKLELRVSKEGVPRLTLPCTHAGGCNTVLTGPFMPSISQRLVELHAMGTEHAAGNATPTCAEADAAASKGREMIAHMIALPLPSPLAVERLRSGWTAWRSNRDPNTGAIVGWDPNAERTKNGKRKPPHTLGESSACLMLRVVKSRRLDATEQQAHDEALVQWKAMHTCEHDPEAAAALGLLGVIDGAAASDPADPPLRAIEVDEAARVLRATDAFGVLGTFAGKVAPDAAAVRAKYDAAVVRLDGKGGGDNERRAHALARLQAARDALLGTGAQDAFARAKATMGSQSPITHTLVCPIDVGALRDFAGNDAALAIPMRKDGEPFGGTYRERIERLLAAVTTAKEDVRTGTMTLEYRHSPLGSVLVAAGFVSSSREYATGADPFKEPKLIRTLALARFGLDFDDTASYPHARLAIVDAGRDLCRRFLDSRETIMRQVGDHFLVDTLPHERRDKVKVLFNALDMDGTYEGWRKKMGVKRSITLDGLRIKDDHDRDFSMGEYLESQQASTKELADKMRGMLALIEDWNVAYPGDKSVCAASAWAADGPKRTLKSYVLQEMEGFSRNAKLWWCAAGGHVALNLQHDGVVLALNRVDQHTARSELAQVSSMALRYKQEVEVKEMKL